MAIPGYDVNRTKYPGLGRTSGGLGGATPQQTITGYTVDIQKPLYKSPREVALLLDKTIRSGYGSLPRGTILAKDENTDKLVPYAPDTISTEDVARVFLLADLNASDSFDVDLLESYKVASGETVIFTDTDDAYEEATVSDVDRTSSNYKATVTLSSAVSGEFNTAKDANCYLKAEDADSGKRSKAKYILDMDVDTGAGEYAKGGLGAVLLSNAILYKNAIPNIDDQAITDLGNVSEDEGGAYYIVK
jgi:hypothetical protein